MRRLIPRSLAHRNLIIKVVAALTVLCLIPPVAKAQLVPVLEPPPFNTNTHEVTTLFFLDLSHGWVVVEDHDRQQFRLFRTDDGGIRWKRWQIPSGVFRVFFVDPQLGWALKLVQGKAPDDQAFHLLRTDDGGKSWKDTSSKPIIDSRAAWHGSAREFAFVDSRRGWVIGAGPPVNSQLVALILQASDGGRSVHRVVDIPKSLWACSGIFASRQAGVWVYGEGYVIHSNDFGATWEPASELKPLVVGDPFLPRSILFRSSGRGWLSGTSMKAVIWGTEDFGKHWRKEMEMGDYLSFDNLSSWDDDHVCATMNSDLFCTANGGSTWQQKKDVLITSPGAGLITKLVILPSGRGWFLCQGGWLYQTDDAGRTWVALDLLDQRNPPN
jgi:photosystem II stability/assembly factor-like uncharacterized protein